MPIKLEYNFSKKKFSKKIFADFKKINLNQKNIKEILSSFEKNYKFNFDLIKLKKYKKKKYFKIIGIGGSSQGSKAIYNFLDYKIKKKFIFLDNIYLKKKIFKKKSVNLIISKSGNTLETIVNSNIYASNKDLNLVITENKRSLLAKIANKLKCEIIEHNNFVGGRYSVLSETGMVPAYLMGLDPKKFKNYNNLINNKVFIKNLIHNVSLLLDVIKKKYTNLVILNYDEKSKHFLKWYQQLFGESIGKKKSGLLPTISIMPQDNHSLLQYYLDGPKKSLYTFFSVFENDNQKINKFKFEKPYSKLSKYSSCDILFAQKLATEKVFLDKKIPYRKFHILKRDEETLGELFCFFMLEVILLGRALKLNPFDQPAVELVKYQTKKILF
tara:strand:+ start:464 stop:1618 length:1155 start_codon:yes stop_codon:yes gene_type:complete